MKEKKITAEPPTYGEMWFMDAEFCEECDELLDGFGVCPNCGWGELDDQYDEDRDEPWWDEEDA